MDPEGSFSHSALAYGATVALDFDGDDYRTITLVMSATLASRAFATADTTDRYLTLANSEYVRKLSFGRNWTRIKLAELRPGNGHVAGQF